jgi:hypothetical protein
MRKKNVRFIILFGLFLYFTTTPVFADGWPLNNGRFPGRVTVLELTKSQKAFLDLIRRCSSGQPPQRTHGDLISNEHTPFVFSLTHKQSAILKKDAGFSPSRFAVFESYRGDTGIDIEVNVINRFNENEFEVPHKLLTHDKDARNWEVNIIGWLPNPLTNATPKEIETGQCPIGKRRTPYN